MYVNKHFQFHKGKSPCFPFVSSQVRTINFGRKSVEENPNLVVDQFFSQEHNLRDGFISTAPDMYDDPQAASHLGPDAPEQRMPQGMTDDDLHALVISKKVQTPAELAKLRKLRPVQEELDPVDPPASDPVDPATPQPNSE